MSAEIINSRYKEELLTGKETFCASQEALSDLTVLDYWQWAYSELIQSMQRGSLAEFIVKTAMEKAGLKNANRVRLNLELQDLAGPDIDDGTGGKVPCRIEVKSASNINGWQPSTNKFSPVFRIAKSQIIDPEKGYVNKEEGSYCRQSDLYVFCVFYDEADNTEEKISSRIMLNLDYWKFYLLETEKLTKALGDAKTISMNRLLELCDEKNPLTFETLGPAIFKKCEHLKKNCEEPTKYPSVNAEKSDPSDK